MKRLVLSLFTEDLTELVYKMVGLCAIIDHKTIASPQDSLLYSPTPVGMSR